MHTETFPRETAPAAAWDDANVSGDPFEAAPAWSRSQAEAWRRGHPPASPWRVVAAQALAGMACAGIAAAVTQHAGTVLSSLWGGATVVLPSALLARGMTRRVGHPTAAAAGFMFWETVKVGVAIAMLAIAGRVVRDLSWPALLVTLFVCIKVNWIALLGRGGRSGRPAGHSARKA